MKIKKLNKLLVKKIKEYKTILIAKHQFPDWDAQGSAIGLANIIKENFKDKEIYVLGKRLNDDKSFLISELKLTDNLIKDSLLITVDTANADRIDFDRFFLAKETFKIDHHIPSDNYGTYNYVIQEFIACTQVITLWAKAMGLKINKDGAENLYRGLLTDSGRFLFPATNDKTFEAATVLLQSGINIIEIHNQLYTYPLRIKQWTSYAFTKMKMNKKGVAYIIVTNEDIKKFKLTYDEAKSALSTMAGIKEIKIWASIIEWEGAYKVSLRSREYDVNSVATKYNGGGHKLASGAKFNNLNQVDKLVNDLSKLIK